MISLDSSEVVSDSDGDDDRTSSVVSRRSYLRTAAAVGVGSAAVVTLSRTADASDGGDELWRFETDDDVRSSPTVVDGTAFVGSNDGFVYAVDAESGDERWRFEASRGVETSPTVVGGGVFVASGDRLYALDAETGVEAWSAAVDTGGPTGTPSPTVVDGRVYVGVEDEGLRTFDAATGSELWHFDVGDSIRASPVVADGTVFFGGYSTYAYALDAASGDPRWTERLDYDVKGLTVGDGTLYAGTQIGRLHALDPETGSERWRFEVDRGNVATTPTVAGGTVFVGSGGGTLYAVNGADGRAAWEFDTGGFVSSSPTVVGDAVVFGSGGVYAVDAGSGERRWRFETGDDVASSPTVTDGTVVVGSDDGNLYGLEAGVGGSSVDSRVRFGTLGHHGDWQYAGQSLALALPDDTTTDRETTAGTRTDTGSGTESPDGTTVVTEDGETDAGSEETAKPDGGVDFDDDGSPGFGLPGGVAAVGTVAYLLRRRLRGDGDRGRG